MADYVLPNHLGRRLDELAQRKNLSRDELMEKLLDEEQAKADREREIHLTVIRSLYPLARRYWQEVGDEKRLALTDEQLDEQFWLIDYDGIPRLKEDEGTFELPPDPLEDMIGILGDGPEDLSSTVSETLKKIFSKEVDDDKRRSA